MTFLNIFEGVESESAIISKSPKWKEGGGLSIVNLDRRKKCPKNDEVRLDERRAYGSWLDESRLEESRYTYKNRGLSR